MTAGRKKKVIIGILVALCMTVTGCAGSVKKGTKYLEEKDYKNAEVEFQDAVDKKKNLGEAYRGLGLCYWEQKKYEKAEKALEKALKNGTEETATLYNILGICDLELDKPEKAVYYFENGQELSGVGKELLKEMAYNLVVAYEKAGDYQSAKEKLDSYLKANPDDKKALKEQEFLNTQISEGGITETSADVRIILQAALLTNATAIILAHNHPSGKLRPSRQDIALTEQVKKAAEIMRITVIDHIILTDDSYYSFADEGQL